MVLSKEHSLMLDSAVRYIVADFVSTGKITGETLATALGRSGWQPDKPATSWVGVHVRVKDDGLDFLEVLCADNQDDSYRQLAEHLIRYLERNVDCVDKSTLQALVSAYEEGEYEAMVDEFHHAVNNQWCYTQKASTYNSDEGWTKPYDTSSMKAAPEPPPPPAPPKKIQYLATLGFAHADYVIRVCDTLEEAKTALRLYNRKNAHQLLGSPRWSEAHCQDLDEDERGELRGVWAVEVHDGIPYINHLSHQTI